MSHVQLALHVDDLAEAIVFYSRLFNTSPAKVKPGYANFVVTQPPLKLVLIENPGHGGTLTQDKAWVSGPGGEKWEVYTVLADAETFGTRS